VGLFDESLWVLVPWGRTDTGLRSPDNFTPVSPRCQAICSKFTNVTLNRSSPLAFAA
jgi:hypothetical protein